MDPQRWKQVDRLLQSALDVAVCERDTFLRRECEGDESLEREIGSLLRSHREAESFLETPAIVEAARAIGFEGEPELRASCSPSAGQSISHYRIVEKLGAGGMGVVYKAEDTRLRRFVALKFLSETLATHPRALERLRSEAQAASALNHPHICTVYDIAEQSEQAFIVMEHLEGETLRQRIKGQPLAIDQILPVARQILGALQAAHQKGIIHGDIKPANIFLTLRGDAKVLDFGLAKLTEVDERPANTRATDSITDEVFEDRNVVTSTANKHLTPSSTAMGTIAYMSPEQARGELSDARADLFSFGALLYEMATGQMAFGASTNFTILQATAEYEPIPPSQLNPTLPASLLRIIGKALLQDRECRYQAASEILTDLKAVEDDLKSGASIDCSKKTHPAPLGLFRRRPQRVVIILATAIAGLALFFTADFLLHTARPSQPADFHVVPLTSSTGLELQPSLSPDGTRVAYAWSMPPQKQAEIYVKLIGPGDAVKVSKDLRRVFSPAWSPNGRWIAASQDLGQMGAVILIPASGGQFKVLARLRKGYPGADACPLSTFPTICGLNSFLGSVLAWSPDGKYLFTPAVVVAGSPPAIVRISVETGEVQSVTNPPSESSGDFGPAVSPDGKHLAFARFRSPRTGDLYIIPLTEENSNSRQEPVRVTTDGADLFTPAWTPDNRALVFSSNRAGRRELWRVLASGGTPLRILGVGEDALDVALSQNGRTLVYNHGHSAGSLWKIPISGGKGGEPVRVTASIARDKYPQFSPDGKQITFESGRSGVDEIWVSDADGTNAIQLTTFGRGISGTPRWSPDGRRIAFDSNVSGSFDIYVVPSHGGPTLQLTKNSSSDAIPSWSRDGGWIYFTSMRTGHAEVWKIRANGGSEAQVTTDGGKHAVESADGRDLYFVRGDEDLGDLFRMQKDGGKATRILSSVNGRLFTVFAKGIYFAAGFPHTELRYLDFETNSIRVISPLPGVPYADVSSDEHWALYPQAAMSDTNLMVVENFR